MKFFIPAADDEAQAARVYDATRQFMLAQMTDQLSNRRIYRIQGVHNGKPFHAKVGEAFEPLVGEVVVAIFLDSLRDCYLVCTLNRGVARGMPYLVGSNEAHIVEDFEDEGGQDGARV
jgi:hypothetical protein